MDLLKSYVNAVVQSKQWERYLALVEYVYNNTVQKSTGKSPLKIVEDWSKVPPILRMHQKIFTANEYVHDLQASFQKIKDAIHKSQQKQKRMADKHQCFLAFLF